MFLFNPKALVVMVMDLVINSLNDISFNHHNSFSYKNLTKLFVRISKMVDI